MIFRPPHPDEQRHQARIELGQVARRKAKIERRREKRASESKKKRGKK